MRRFLTLTGLVLTLAFLALANTGCAYSRTEHAAWRDGFYKGSATERGERQEWAQILAGDNNGDGTVAADEPIELSRLPDLRQAAVDVNGDGAVDDADAVAMRQTWLRARTRAHEETIRLYEQDKARDKGPGGIFGTTPPEGAPVPPAPGGP